MVSQRATALSLNESELAELEIKGASRPVTRTALTAAQVVALLREIAPVDAAALLDAGRAASFAYVSDDGAFDVRTSREGAGWRARVTIDQSRERERLGGTIRSHSQPAPLPAVLVSPVAPVQRSAPVSPAGTNNANGESISMFDGSDRAQGPAWASGGLPADSRDSRDGGADGHLSRGAAALPIEQGARPRDRPHRKRQIHDAVLAHRPGEPIAE